MLPGVLALLATFTLLPAAHAQVSLLYWTRSPGDPTCTHTDARGSTFTLTCRDGTPPPSEWGGCLFNPVASQLYCCTPRGELPPYCWAWHQDCLGSSGDIVVPGDSQILCRYSTARWCCARWHESCVDGGQIERCVPRGVQSPLGGDRREEYEVYPKSETIVGTEITGFPTGVRTTSRPGVTVTVVQSPAPTVETGREPETAAAPAIGVPAVVGIAVGSAVLAALAVGAAVCVRRRRQRGRGEGGGDGDGDAPYMAEVAAHERFAGELDVPMQAGRGELEAWPVQRGELDAAQGAYYDTAGAGTAGYLPGREDGARKSRGVVAGRAG